MPIPVNQYPTSFDFAFVQTGKPVGNASMQRLAQEVSFLAGQNLHCYFDTTIHPRAAARTNLNAISTWGVPFRFMKSPAAQVAAVIVQLAPGYSTTGRVKITVTLPTGATWLAANGLDGSVNFRYPPDGRVAQAEIIGLIDISAINATTVNTGVVTCDLLTTTGISQGLKRVRIIEVPLAALDPGNPTTEPALNQAWALSPNPMWDGGSSVSSGFQRLAYLMDTYRANYRKHFSVVGVEAFPTYGDTVTPHWYHTGGSAGNLDWMYNTGSVVPSFLGVARNLYAVSSGTEAYKLHIRYRNFHASTGVTLDFVTLDNGGAGGPVAQSLSLAATNSVWAWTTVDVTIPGYSSFLWKINNVLCSAANPLVEFSAFILIENGS